MADWRDDAACSGRDLSIFFPPKDGGNGSLDNARQICSECPVIDDCLEDAVATEGSGRWAIHGFRGGMSIEERIRFYRQIKRPAQKSVLTVRRSA